MTATQNTYNKGYRPRVAGQSGPCHQARAYKSFRARAKYRRSVNTGDFFQNSPTCGNHRYAFTLTELLVVIGLTALLLVLILGPLLQAFNLTNRARALTEAQDASRFGIEQLRRELSQATYVYDNANAPILMPLGPDADGDFTTDTGDTRAQQNQNVYPGGNPRPSVLFGKIDFVPAATQGEGPATVIDPTTDKPLGGRPLVLPLAPGQRIVRYFVGLRNNTLRNGTSIVPAFYTNPYEFRGTDNALNPFTLYRVEFDPSDANLINQANFASPLTGDGGLNDPNFFYNTSTAPNGRTYAENWRAIASPILNGANADLISWVRGSGRQFVAGASPFRLLVEFRPAAILGETATPGFINSAGGTASDAVPTQYSARYGNWTLPFTLTFNRATTSGAAPGQIQFRVSNEIQGNGTTLRRVEMLGATGSLVSNNHYWMTDANNGNLFVFTERLAFFIDAARGRIETAIPPLAAQNGIPLHFAQTDTGLSTVATQLTAGIAGNNGVLIPTVFRRNTRSEFAGQTNNGVTFFNNQGVVAVSLAQAAYFPAFTPLPAFSTLTNPYASPFTAFGSGNFNSVRIVSASERVQGPDGTVTVDNNGTTEDNDDQVRLTTSNGEVLLTTYFALSPGADATALRKSSGKLGGNQWVWNGGEMTYILENLPIYQNAPSLQFDGDGNTDPAVAPYEVGEEFAGLPAQVLGASVPQGELRVSFLWQNNYARNQAGLPLNTKGQPVTSLSGSGGNVTPEADVLRVDYSTRSAINVVLGTQVYDTSNGQPQTAQVSDRVVVGNALR